MRALDLILNVNQIYPNKGFVIMDFQIHSFKPFQMKPESFPRSDYTNQCQRGAIIKLLGIYDQNSKPGNGYSPKTNIIARFEKNLVSAVKVFAVIIFHLTRCRARYAITR